MAKLSFFDHVLLAFEGKETPTISPAARERCDLGSLLYGMQQTVSQNNEVQDLLLLLRGKSSLHYFHSVRVGVMFRFLTTQEKGLDQALSPYTLDLAGLLHDYGKVFVPEEILNKEGELTVAERGVMREHNRLGFLCLKKLEQHHFPHLAEIAIRHHQYPRQNGERREGERRSSSVKGEALEVVDERNREQREEERRKIYPPIERAGVLLSLADAYDALASRRSYKAPFSPKAIQEHMSARFPQEGLFTEMLLECFSPPTGGRQ